MTGVQTCALPIFTHSLRWRDAEVAGAKAARIFICVVWMAMSLLWTLEGGRESVYGCGAASVVVLALCGLRRALAGDWSPRVVPISAAIVILLRPSLRLADALSSASPGYVAVAASFLLFALGTVAAFTRHRWQRNNTS